METANHFHKRDAKLLRVLGALNAGQQLTGLDIIKRFNYLNYTDLISKLRKRGHPVQTRMIKLKDSRFAVYYIKKQTA